MKIAVIYFCYSGDEELLHISVDCMKLLKTKYDIDIFLIDDHNNPIKNIPSDTTYIKSTFNRNGNLNGIPCMYGMLHYYNEIIKTHDWVFKVDPDVIVNDFDFLSNLNTEQIAQVGTKHQLDFKGPCVCHGCFHGFSNFGINNIVTNIDSYIDKLNQDIKERDRFPEDYVSCRLACLDNPEYNSYTINKYNNPLIEKERGVYFDFKWTYKKHSYIKNLPVSVLKDYCAISFKPIDNLNINSCINRMKQYKQFMTKKYNI